MTREGRGSIQPPETAVIASKVSVPPRPEQLVARPRVERQLRSLIDRHRVVVVSATAGAGKTTAVAEAVLLGHRRVAWLAVDRTDALPGRLLAYLEAALARQLPHLAGAAMRALAAGIPHAEAAGLLAEAVGDEQLVLVVEDLERLDVAREAWAVIESLLRYAPPGMRIVLVSRRDIPAGVCELPEAGAVPALREADLAFTPSEAAEALARQGQAGIDAAAAVEATGGWVTGVLFEAWRSADHITGVGGEADPLHGYLASHILAKLAPHEREFLVGTSLLDEVSASRAESLGFREAGERLVALRAAHLPVNWEPDGRVMRCHARFREYLLERLERQGEDRVCELRLAHGRLLAEEGHDEEATEELLRAGAPDEALITAERAIVPVIERLDFSVAERWLEALAHVAPPGASTFTTAELMVAWGREDYRRAVRIADELAALGEREDLARASGRAAALMAWCYLMCARPDGAEDVLAIAEEGDEVRAARYLLRVYMAEGRTPAPPQLSGGAFDALVLIGKYFSGRFLDLLDAVPASRWVDSVTTPWRIGALRAAGRTQQALELYEAAQAAGMTSLSLHTVVAPELLLDAGRLEEAREAIARGQRLARQSGAIAYQIGEDLMEAKFALRAHRDPAAARVVLDRLEAEPLVRQSPWSQAQIDTWYGLAILMESPDIAPAERLRRAVETMLAGDWHFALPPAAVYLAEAEWRAGNEAAADRAADLALEAARRQGSNHLLLQALRDFPAVASRRIDAEPGADSPWHDLGRALLAQGVTIEARVRMSVELVEFGRCAILVNGEEVRPGISKSFELLAYLSTRPGAQVDREELLDALFDGRDDDSTRAYLRQAVHRLRQVVPEGALIREQLRVGLGDDVAIGSESTRFESRLVEAARLQGEDRLEATLDALAIFDRGAYLPKIRSAWADQRREALADLALDARSEAAELALTAERYAEAQRLSDEVLRADPFREGVWRLRMRVANALGDEDGVIAAYQGCEDALDRLDTTPAPSTRRLLSDLRR